MPGRPFPDIDPVAVAATRGALHDYATVLGAWLKACRPRRKHWWHASLRPSLTGLTTGVVHAGITFELELDLRASRLRARTPLGNEWTEALTGQSASDLAAGIRTCLTAEGIDLGCVPDAEFATTAHEDYSTEQASRIAGAVNSVSGALGYFRAGLAEETSPIQLWPHHFDLSMLWFSGDKIPGEDPDDEEASDKQINFGLSFGDDSIDEPYLYITAYPAVDGFKRSDLPGGARWHDDAFRGVALTYRDLLASADRQQTLIELWTELLRVGRSELMRTNKTGH